MSKRRSPAHGLGQYDREYEWTRVRLLDLRGLEARALRSVRALRRAVASGSASQAFKAKQAAQEALSNLSRSYDTAHITLETSVRKLEGLPSHAPFTKAHALARQYRREVAKARALKQKLSRVAFGSLDEMKGRLSTTKFSRDADDLRRYLAHLQSEHPEYTYGTDRGRVYTRIWKRLGHQSTRSVVAFVDADGVIYRAESWKARGRPVGHLKSVARDRRARRRR